jgi:hypothetical protein
MFGIFGASILFAFVSYAITETGQRCRRPSLSRHYVPADSRFYLPK